MTRTAILDSDNFFEEFTAQQSTEWREWRKYDCIIVITTLQMYLGY